MIMARTQLLSRQAPCHPSSSTSMSPTLIAHPPHGQEAYHGYQPHPTTTTTHSWQYDGWRCGRIVVRSLRAAATTRHSLPTVLSVCDPSFLYRHTPSPRERTRSCSFHDNCVGPRKRSWPCKSTYHHGLRTHEHTHREVKGERGEGGGQGVYLQAGLSSCLVLPTFCKMLDALVLQPRRRLWWRRLSWWGGKKKTCFYQTREGEKK